MTTDPVETISNGLRMLTTNSMSDNFDVQAHQTRMLNSGPFAEAQQRQSIWTMLANKQLTLQDEPDLLNKIDNETNASGNETGASDAKV
jgi:hypothetical protein